MSSKLVKKQLGSILAGAVEKSTGASHKQHSNKSKRRQNNLKSQNKVKKERGSSKDAIRRANLQYYTQTSKPSAATKDLWAKVLTARGVAQAAPTVDATDEEFDFGDDGAFF